MVSYAVMLSILAFSAVPGARSVILVDLDDRNTPPIIYTGTWKQVTNEVLNGSISNYYDGTDSHTQTPGDTVSLKFTGVQIAYWADKDYSNALINITLDDTSTTLTPYNPVFLGQQVLYNVTGLENKTHIFTITHIGTSGLYMNVDRLQYGYLPPDTSSHSSKTNIGAIVAGSVIGGIALALLILGAFVFVRRRAKKKKAEEDLTLPTSYDLVQEVSFVSPGPEHPLHGVTPSAESHNTAATNLYTQPVVVPPNGDPYHANAANTPLDQFAQIARPPTAWSDMSGAERYATPPPRYPDYP